MIVTINMIDDKKEKLLAVWMMQNVTMGHLQMSLRKHLRKYVGNIRR